MSRPMLSKEATRPCRPLSTAMGRGLVAGDLVPEAEEREDARFDDDGAGAGRGGRRPCREDSASSGSPISAAPRCMLSIATWWRMTSWRSRVMPSRSSVARQHEHRHDPHRRGVVAHHYDSDGGRARHDQSCPRVERATPLSARTRPRVSLAARSGCRRPRKRVLPSPWASWLGRSMSSATVRSRAVWRRATSTRARTVTPSTSRRPSTDRSPRTAPGARPRRLRVSATRPARAATAPG